MYKIIQDYLTVLTFMTQFSGTTCPILMRLTHSIEGSVKSLHTKFETDFVIQIDIKNFNIFIELTVQCFSMVL